MIEVDLMELGASGFWIFGSAGQYRFQAQLFHDHADNDAWELANSKISRLWIQHDRRTVFNWDRGLDVDAQTEDVQDLVVRLCSELPVLPYRPGDRIRLLEMDDPDPVPVGSLGTVTTIRNMRRWIQIEVNWDNGRRLMLSVPPDRVEICKWRRSIDRRNYGEVNRDEAVALDALDRPEFNLHISAPAPRAPRPKQQAQR